MEFARDQRFKLYGDGRFYEISADPDEQSSLAPRDLDDQARSAHAKLRGPLARYR